MSLWFVENNQREAQEYNALFETADDIIAIYV